MAKSSASNDCFAKIEEMQNFARRVGREKHVSSSDKLFAMMLDLNCHFLRQHITHGNSIQIAQKSDKARELFEYLNKIPMIRIGQAFADCAIHDQEKGRAFEGTETEMKIVRYMASREEAPMKDFVRAVWTERFNRFDKKRCKKYRTAVSKLSEKFEYLAYSISITEDEQVIRKNHLI